MMEMYEKYKSGLTSNSFSLVLWHLGAIIRNIEPFFEVLVYKHLHVGCWLLWNINWVIIMKMNHLLSLQIVHCHLGKMHMQSCRKCCALAHIIFLHENICYGHSLEAPQWGAILGYENNEIQTALCIPTLDTMTKFVIMTICLSQIKR